MKNIHVLPTENSSRLSYNKDGVLELHRLQWRKNTQNIYITSDEEIKNGDFAYDSTSKTIVKFDFIKDRGDKVLIAGVHSINLDDNYTDLLSNFKKIILTTDQDFIKDGVQAIDDEFLEWFIDKANDSGKPIDIVEVEEVYFNGSSYYDTNQLSELEKKLYSYLKEYKIIIPKEEPKFEDSIENSLSIMSIANDMFGKKEEPTLANMRCTCMSFDPNCFTGSCRKCGFPPEEKPKLTNTINKDELDIPKGSLTELIGVNKQETLEGLISEYHSIAYEKLVKGLTEQETTAEYIDRHIVEAMVEVAKQKMYSKEEVFEILNQFSIACYSPIEKFEIPEWFEKYKKK
jgi:hypothetical protein